jgi:hypothetical protein
MIAMNRQPKGASNGGEFAANVNAESTVELNDSTLELLAVGTVLSNGVEIVPWIEPVENYDDDMVVQLWTKEWGEGPNDFSGITVRYIATVMDEMGDSEVTESKLRDFFDDTDYAKVALRPDVSPADLLEQVSDKILSLRRDDDN